MHKGMHVCNQLLNNEDRERNRRNPLADCQFRSSDETVVTVVFVNIHVPNKHNPNRKWCLEHRIYMTPIITSDNHRHRSNLINSGTFDAIWCVILCFRAIFLQYFVIYVRLWFKKYRAWNGKARKCQTKIAHMKFVFVFQIENTIHWIQSS